MKTTINNLTVLSVFKGEKCAPWNKRDNTHCHHRIILKNSVDRVGFDFWASLNNPVIDTKEALLDALGCIVNDALIGQDSFEDMIDLYGCEDAKEAYRTWKECKKTYRKLSKVCSDISLLNEQLLQLQGE